MNELFDKLKNSKKTGLYNDLSELYDFVYKRHYNYDFQLDLVLENTTDEHTIILEGACGSGRLTKRLSEHFDSVTAFDINEGMLDIAQQRNLDNTNILKQDMTKLTYNSNFDVYTVLGNALTHLVEDRDFKNFSECGYKALKKDGILIFDYMLKENMKEGYIGSKKFCSEDYEVERHITSIKETQDVWMITFIFIIRDKKSNENVTISEVIPSRAYNDNYVISTLENTGFSDVEVIKYDKESDASVDDSVIVAQK